jgi:hypothetical protein
MIIITARTNTTSAAASVILLENMDEGILGKHLQA